MVSKVTYSQLNNSYMDYGYILLCVLNSYTAIAIHHIHAHQALTDRSLGTFAAD